MLAISTIAKGLPPCTEEEAQDILSLKMLSSPWKFKLRPQKPADWQQTQNLGLFGQFQFIPKTHANPCSTWWTVLLSSSPEITD